MRRAGWSPMMRDMTDRFAADPTGRSLPARARVVSAERDAIEPLRNRLLRWRQPGPGQVPARADRACPGQGWSQPVRGRGAAVLAVELSRHGRDPGEGTGVTSGTIGWAPSTAGPTPIRLLIADRVDGRLVDPGIARCASCGWVRALTPPVGSRRTHWPAPSRADRLRGTVGQLRRRRFAWWRPRRPGTRQKRRRCSSR